MIQTSVLHLIGHVVCDVVDSSGRSSLLGCLNCSSSLFSTIHAFDSPPSHVTVFSTPSFPLHFESVGAHNFAFSFHRFFCAESTRPPSSEQCSRFRHLVLPSFTYLWAECPISFSMSLFRFPLPCFFEKSLIPCFFLSTEPRRI